LAVSRARIRPSLDGIHRHKVGISNDAVAGYRRSRRLKWVGLFTALLVVLVLAIITAAYPLAPLASLWRPGTYLVLFENDAELRPSGGFIGSYAVVTVHPNRTASYQIQTNIYKLDNPFIAEHPITPPAPLQGITDRWSLRDSNWDIDFPTASKTIQQFYQLETGQSVDGVIAVTAKAGKELLGSIGSVKLSDGTVLANDDNFYNILAYKVEKEYFVDPANRTANEPKQLLANLVPTVARRLLSPINDWRVSIWLQHMLQTKQILLSFNDNRQSVADQHGWSDRINATSQAYASLNNANLGGMKSSQYLSQVVRLDITTVGNVATYAWQLTRTHRGTGVWPDHRNDNLTRIVMPLGATPATSLLAGQPVQPTTIEVDAGRTAIGYRIDTVPGTSQQLVAQFSVPIDPTLSRTFTWQSQPGVSGDMVHVTYNNHVILDGEIDHDYQVQLP